MQILKPDETLIAFEENFVPGMLLMKKAYDIYLAKKPSGDYVLIVFMKIQFIFHDNEGLTWSAFEKDKYEKKWLSTVEKHWGNRIIKKLKNGKKVVLNFRFSTKKEEWPKEHWKFNVKIIPKGKFGGSYVRPTVNDTTFYSEDLNVLQRVPGAIGVHEKTDPLHLIKQRVAVHEFGHMLGSPDEYSSLFLEISEDYESIMNIGEKILPRHDLWYVLWLEQMLKSNNVTFEPSPAIDHLPGGYA